MVEFIRQNLFKADEWLACAVVIQADVKAAFDVMRRSVIFAALSGRGGHPLLLAAFMREMEGLSAQACMGSVFAQPVEYSLGGRQGGRETPQLWNEVIGWLASRLQPSWEARQMGLMIGGSMGSDSAYRGFRSHLAR